ncbi:MAG TPA: hypothetical protein G4N94_06090 [Caldilineae bacterium]|nr:hypothetical protein [Caldilineae bacterium]
MAENRKSSISEASTLREIGAFWDTHDFTDFDSDAPDVKIEFASSIAIEPDLLSEIEDQASMRGVTVETLVNLWLQEKLVEQRALLPA